MTLLLVFLSLGSFAWLALWYSAMKTGNQRILVSEIPFDEKQNAWPKISVIIPVRNEEARIESAVSTLLNQDYPALEVIAVNDRSTDKTGEILDRVAKANPKLRVFHNAHLPKDWMGKPFALQQGAQIAQGEWLIFTDADAQWGQNVLKKIMTKMQNTNADFASMLYEPIVQSFWERLFLMAFYNFGLMTWNLWNVDKAESRANLGVGVFCMMKKTVLEKIGGMEKFKLSIPSDVALGKAAKFMHFKCLALLGKDIFWCRWQEGLKGHILGLEKNFFALCEFNYVKAAVVGTFIFLMNFGPFLGIAFGLYEQSLFFTAFNLLGFASICFFGKHYGDQLNWSWYHLLMLPIGSLFLIGALVWSVIQTTKNKGISWRETYYSKQTVLNHIRERDQWLEKEWLKKVS